MSHHQREMLHLDGGGGGSWRREVVGDGVVDFSDKANKYI